MAALNALSHGEAVVTFVRVVVLFIEIHDSSQKLDDSHGYFLERFEEIRLHAVRRERVCAVNNAHETEFLKAVVRAGSR